MLAPVEKAGSNHVQQEERTMYIRVENLYAMFVNLKNYLKDITL